MLTNLGLLSGLVFVAVFLATCGLLVFLFARPKGDARRGIARLRKLAAPDSQAEDGARVGKLFQGFLTRAGTLLLPGSDRRARLEAQMYKAGLYGAGAMRTFLGVKLLLATLWPVAAALSLFLAGTLALAGSLLAGAVVAEAGLVAPGLWLDHLKRKRQSNLRRALPDALDLLVLCVEGGVSLKSALTRVTEDLAPAHPLLTAELNIVQREMDMGASAGEAIKRFGERCDLEDVRNLASVLLQSERFGAGVAKALRIHADVCRQERQQRAEEMAQKAAVKILFPTLLCIFPAIFIVLLGPAAYQMVELFSKTR